MSSGFACQECGYKFRTLAAAERASFGPDGCPKCGGADIDLGAPSAHASSCPGYYDNCTNDNCSNWNAEAHGKTRAPADLQVGDRVQYEGRKGEVARLHNGGAEVIWADGRREFYHRSDSWVTFEILPVTLRQRFERVCALITNPNVPDAEVTAAVATFKALPADPDKEKCLLAIEDTMGSRTGAR
jgi:hypothetical protein